MVFHQNLVFNGQIQSNLRLNLIQLDQRCQIWLNLAFDFVIWNSKNRNSNEFERIHCAAVCFWRAYFADNILITYLIFRRWLWLPGSSPCCCVRHRLSSSGSPTRTPPTARPSFNPSGELRYVRCCCCILDFFHFMKWMSIVTFGFKLCH